MTISFTTGVMDITGVYRIVNSKNGKSYIGFSNDIEKRISDHKSRTYSEGKEYDKTLYRAIRKYGWESFEYEVLLECSVEDLAKEEIRLISEYDTFHNGYNETPGGEGVRNNQGEQHPNSSLSQLDVESIRKRYSKRERKMEVRKDYPQIGDSGFHKIWTGETWKSIMPEVYTKENILFHTSNSNMGGSKNGMARLNESKVYNIRVRKSQGESSASVYMDYKHLLTKASFMNVWGNFNWKNVIV